MRCPSTSDQPFYDDATRGITTAKRAAASYGVVISGTIGNPVGPRPGELSSHMDDGSPGATNGPFQFNTLVHARFDGPFNHGDAAQLIKQVQNMEWKVVWPKEFAAPGVKLLAS